MTPQEIQAWYAEHGGAAGPPEGPDANGITVHRAADGSFINVRRDGSLAMRGVAPGGATSSSAQAPATPPSGIANQVNDDASFQAWLDQHGGEIGRKDTHGKTSDPSGEIDPATNKPKQIDTVVSTTVQAKDGATITLARKPSGEGYTFIGNTPPKATSAQQPQTVATNTTEPYIITRNPDGTLRTDPNPNYKPAEAQKGTTQFVKGGDGRTYAVPIDAQGRAGKPVDTGLPPDAKPGSVVSVKTPNGTQLVRVDADGRASVVFTAEQGEEIQQDKDGTWVAVRRDANGNATVRQVAVQGQPTAQGPALPHIVLGQSQTALRAYRDQLNQQVGAGIITPAVADKRWKEATDIAGFAITEAQTLQRDEESRRNADVNLRTNAMSNATSGFNSALDFVSKLNGQLPEGSTAGGKALEAILGMQQIQARRMGAFDNPFSGGAPRSQEARGIDAATASTIATTNSEIGRLTAPGAATPSAPAAPEQAAPTAATPAAPAAAPTAPPPTMGPAPASTTLPSNRPDQTQAAPQIENAINPPAAAPIINEVTGQPALGTDYARPGDPGYQDQAPIFSPVPAMKQDTPPSETYGPGQFPGGRVLTPPPSGAGDAGDVSMAPGGEDFAALAPFSRAPNPVYPRLAPPDAGPTDFAAMRRAQIASTPPWRLSDADLQWAQANGLLDEAMAVPGRRIA